MYAPTTLSFYSEMDTSVAVSPALLVLKGVRFQIFIQHSKSSFQFRQAVRLSLMRV